MSVREDYGGGGAATTREACPARAAAVIWPCRQGPHTGPRKAVIGAPCRGLDGVKRPVALGLEHDRLDAEGLTPVKVADWERMPEMRGSLSAFRPDLTHINGDVGTLPRRAIASAAEPGVAEFVTGWAEAHSVQVVDGGPA